MVTFAVARLRSRDSFAFAVALVFVVMVMVSVGCSGQAPPEGRGAADKPPAPQGSTPGTPSQPSSGPAGFLEQMSCDEIRGWAWDPSRPDDALTIELYDGDRLVKTTTANQFRKDLLDARKGNGSHVFRETPPRELRDGKPHTIRAVIKGTGVTLRPLADAPSSMTCAR
jgi:hypothetical protein